MKNRLLTFAGLLALFAVLGKFYAPPLMAQVRAALVQDADQPARAPFQVTVPININNFTYTPVTIPAGKRLVVDYIAASGAAQTSGAYIQPIILLNSSVAGNPSCLYYIGPQQSSTTPGQYYHTEKTTIFADSLSLSPAFAGYTPTFLAFNVTISGHLVSVP
uniref:Uncharacterized protein n=1 Tax=Solibacter usitatus (strain Ellin6076) TaxID=234267 RepID=Q027D7_SOLUE